MVTQAIVMAATLRSTANAEAKLGLGMNRGFPTARWSDSAARGPREKVDQLVEESYQHAFGSWGAILASSSNLVGEMCNHHDPAVINRIVA